MRPTRHDLHVLAAATQRPRELAHLVVGAIINGHEVDVEVRRNGRDYVAVLRVVLGEAIVAEHEMSIVWADLEEGTRYGMLAIYAGQLVASADRTRRRAFAILKTPFRDGPSEVAVVVPRARVRPAGGPRPRRCPRSGGPVSHPKLRIRSYVE